MTTLFVATLEDELIQEIKYNLEERLHVGAFIPYLYVHNASADFFTFELSNTDGVLFEKNFTVSEMKESLGTTDNYFHVFYPIIPVNPIQLEKGEYSVRLIPGTNYTQDGSSFIGWIKQFENIQNEMDYVPLDDNSNSYAIRYKCYKEGIL